MSNFGYIFFKKQYITNFAFHQKVRLSIFNNNKETAFIVFDAFGKTKTNWMDGANILDSSWTDVKSATKNYCSIV